MSDLISRQAAKSAYCAHFCHLGIFCPDGFCSEVNEAFDSVPSAEPEPSEVARDIATIIENEKDMRVIAQPVRKGKWINLHSGNYVCSECAAWWHGDGDEIVENFNFCPNCGVSMSEGEESHENIPEGTL